MSHILNNLSLALLAGLAASSCSNKAIDTKTQEETHSILNVSIPTSNSSAGINKSSNPLLSVGNDKNKDSDSWGLPLPSKIDDITCYAIAVEWPESHDKIIQCNKQSGGHIIPGLFQGLFLPGKQVELKIPSGSDRKIYLLGFSATSQAQCVETNNFERLNVSELSPPIILSEVDINLEKGKASFTFPQNLSLFEPLSNCITLPEPDEPPATTIPNESIPTPETDILHNALNCSDTSKKNLLPGQLACYGIWDFGEFYGGDINMCGADDLMVNAYFYPTTGCQITAKSCSNGIAIASKMFNTYAEWDADDDGVNMATTSEIKKVAAALNSTESLIKQEMIRVWEYRCK